MRPPPAAPRLGFAPSGDTSQPQIQGMEAALDSADVDFPIYEVHDIGEFTIIAPLPPLPVLALHHYIVFLDRCCNG